CYNSPAAMIPPLHCDPISFETLGPHALKLVLQRVTQGSVSVDGEVVGAIDRGLVVLVGIGQGDTDPVATRMIEKLLALRIFADEAGKMNRSVTDVGGGVLMISQFTLYADCRKGRRPAFTLAAP